VVLSLLTENVALPGMGGALHPGARVGVERPWTDGRVSLVQGLHLTGWSHAQLQDAGVLATELRVRGEIGPAFADVAFGLGGMLSHVAAPRFEGDRPYDAATPYDLDLAALIGAGLGVGLNDRTDVWTRMEVLGETPFGLLGNPVLPHRNIHVGVRMAWGGGS
jgi:hypothetical protein